MTDIEKEIDHLVLLWGYRLGQEDQRTRERAKLAIEQHKAELDEWNNRPIPTMPFNGRF